MKRILCLTLAMMMIACAACASATSLLGSWQTAESPELTEDRTALFEKAVEGLLGVSYVPVVYLGNQVVAGTNHCFLCKATVIYPDAVPSYALVYVYEDLQGNCEITDTSEVELGI